MAAASSAQSDLPPPGKIRDLDYGDVLFRFFQDDYFAALVRLEAARQAERLDEHAADAELLAGGLYLSLGMHVEATRRFEQLLAGPMPQSVRDRAFFYLARIGYQRGYFDEARRNLARIAGPLPGDLEPERKLLAANVLMAVGRFEEAARELEGWNDVKGWSDYARYNLGVALVRSGDVARGRQWLEAVGTLEGSREERRALRDRANLALGFALLQERRPEEAAVALNRVRLDGPYTNRALLGLGWAESDAARPQRALVPWLELRGRPVVDSAVQESFLAVPYAYAQLAASGEAEGQYRLAMQAYVDESRRIGESIDAIRGGGFVEAVLAAAPVKAGEPDQAGWFWQLQSAPDAPHTRYLYALLATHEFQEGLKNYRDLRIMRRNLARWSEAMAAFDTMVAARDAASPGRQQRRREALGAVDLESYAARRDALEARIAAIAARRDVVALATSREAAQWDRLGQIRARIGTLPAGPQRDALAERARVLQGSLAWRLDAEYKLRLARLGTEAGAVHAALEETRRRVDRVARAGEEAPRDTRQFAARVHELAGRIAELEPRIATAAVAQERVLADIAIRELEAQQRRLANYATQAQFALAALYDGAATGANR